MWNTFWKTGTSAVRIIVYSLELQVRYVRMGVIFAAHCVIAFLGPSSAVTSSKVFSRVIKYLIKVRKRGTGDLSSSFALWNTLLAWKLLA